MLQVYVLCAGCQWWRSQLDVDSNQCLLAPHTNHTRARCTGRRPPAEEKAETKKTMTIDLEREEMHVFGHDLMVRMLKIDMLRTLSSNIILVLYGSEDL